MSISRGWIAVWIAAFALAVTMLVPGLAQGPQGGQAKGGGQGKAAVDYNIATRTAADKALPNNYLRDETFFKWPAGRKLGSTSAIDIDKDGKSIWVFERCGANICIGPDGQYNSHVNMIMKFDETGKLVKQFGADQIVYPHGIHVDKDGNIWVVDLQSNIDRPAGRGGGAPTPTAAGVVPNGNQVVKYSPDGKVLMKMLVPGVYGTDNAHFSQPSDVVTAPNGDIFVADGHDSAPSNNRIMKFDKSGKFIKAWGKSGTAIGEFNCPHGLAFDSQGRLFVADRGNLRIQIFDQDGNFVAEWKQFGRLSGIHIDKDDVLYGADSQSGAGNAYAFVRGVHIGNAKTGEVTGFIPDPLGNPAPWNPLPGTSGAEGIAVDAKGNIFVSQVNPPGLAKYVKKWY